jgi:hypothetical protein
VADVGQRTIEVEWFQLDGIDFRLIEELAFLQGNRHHCWPSREYLASKLKVSIWTISRHTAKLSSLGLLRIQHRRYRRRDGTWATRSNLYQVLSFIGSKVRQILSLLTGVRRSARIPESNKKSDPPDLSFIKNAVLKTHLESFSRLGTVKVQV